MANLCPDESLIDERDTAALVGHGMRALHDRGDLRTARHWFELACRAADRSGDGAALAEAAIGLGGIWVHEHRRAGPQAQVLSWQRRALPLTADDSQLRLQLRARLAAESDYRDGGHGEVLAVLQQARDRGDPQTLANVLNLAHHCLLGAEHGVTRRAIADELLLVSARTGCGTDLLMALLWRAVDRLLDGDPHAERSLTELTGELAVRDHLAVRYVARSIEVMLAIRAGDFERAEEQAVQCLHLGERCGDMDATGWFRGQLLAIRWFQGRVGELLPELSHQLHSSDLSATDNSPVAGLAVAAAVRGDHRAAAGALTRLGRGDLAQVPPSSTWLVTVYGAVEAAALLSDVEAAASAYRLLEPFGRLPMMGSLAVVCFGSAQHALGLAALTTGWTDRAVEHFRDAVRRNLALGHWPAACLSRSRLADALLRRGRAEDAAPAAREQAHAEHEAARLGMILPATTAAPVPRVATTITRDAGSRPAEIRIRLLGAVDVAGDRAGPSLSGPRRKAVLAVLALQAGEVVSTSRLIDVVWGDRAPRTAANTLQSHVSYLRRVIDGKGTIRAQPPGYLLDLGQYAVDAVVAERLIRQAVQYPDPQDRADRLPDVLALWRGSPLMDVTASTWLDAQAERLTRLRLTGHRSLAEARLALGQHDQALADLEPLADGYPLDEQVHRQLIVALYRAGRQNESLAAYQRLRSNLDELGIEPAPALRQLQVAILRQDEVLA